MKVIILILSFLLPFCINISVKQQQTRKSFANVNVSSVLIDYEDNDEGYDEANFLPPCFHGPYKDRGIYEISSAPGFDIQKDLDLQNKVETTFLFTFVLNELKYIIDNDQLKPLGFEFCYHDENGKEENVSFIKFCHNLSQLIEDYTLENETYVLSRFERGEFFLHEGFSSLFGIRFKVKPNETIKYVRLYYSDVPTIVLKAGIIRNVNDPLDALINTYNLINNENSTQTTKEHLSYYELDSQVSRCYSLQYLKRYYGIEYPSDSEIKVSLYDPDNYFLRAPFSNVGEKYFISLFVKQKQQLIEEIVFAFTIVDTEGPLIKLKKQIPTLSYQTKFDDTFIEEYFFIQDNSYETNIKTQIVTLKEENSLGENTLLLKAWDSLMNESDYEFEVLIIDDVSPLLTQFQKEIILNPSYIMTNEKLLSFFQGEDEIDDECELFVISNDYLPHNQQNGVYEARIGVKDKNENLTEAKITILVQENPYVFYAKNNSFTFYENHIPDLNLLIESLIRQNELANKNYTSIKIIDGNDITNALKYGYYECTIECLADDTSSSMIDISFEVLKENELTEKNESVKDGSSINFWEYFIEFWLEVWRNIIGFFGG